MKKVNGLFAVGAFAMMISGCKQAPPDTHDADVKAIQATEDAWVKEYAAKDAEKLGAHYTDDAVEMMGDSPALVGKRAILDSMMNMLRDPAFAVTFKAKKIDVAKSGDLGYSQGTYTLTMSAPITKMPMKSTGNYVTVYRKQEDGTWQVLEDVVSADAPPPAAPSMAPSKGKAFHATPFD